MSDEVLIIGGGFAGLAAGVALAGAGRRVRVLEQRPHLGGRARSFVESTTGSVVDNGQHLFMGCYHSTIKFLREIGTLDRVRFQPALRVEFLEPNGRLSSLECPRLPQPWHLLAGVLRSRSFNWSEKVEVFRLGRALAAGNTRNGLKRQTVDEWLASLGQSESLRRNFWNLLCIAAMNEDPKIASAALFERVLKLALFSSPEESRLGMACVGLSDCYTQAAAGYIAARGGRVELGRNVAGFLISPGSERRGLGPQGGKANAPLQERGVCEGVKLAEGERIEARAVLSAVPCFELPRLLPGELLRSEPFFTNVLALRPTPIISINLWFDRPVTEHEFVGLRGTTVQWVFNKGRILEDSAFRAGASYLSLVLSGAHAHVGRSKEELLVRALKELEGVLPATRGAQLLHSLVLKERFATFSPSVDADGARPAPRTPVRGLFLAGDWTSTGLPATIEGAVQSGYNAAREILGGEGGTDEK